jgi:hypothetical protein
MPRTPKKPSGGSSSPPEPYPSFPDKAAYKPTTSATSSASKATAWTGAELVQLFRFAMDRNGREWAVAVEGRTASQARQTWA